MRRLWSKINSWLERKSTILGALSSLLQILVFPSALITILLGYFQLSQFLARADLHIEFTTPENLAFTIRNYNDTNAERPSYGFGIFDLDSKPIDTVPIPWKETNYIRGNSGQGPNALMSKYGKKDHRYFGFASVTCENCETQRWYWIYIVHGDSENGWYVEVDKNEPKVWNPIALMNEPEKYIEEFIPKERRIKIQ